jgi:hypothetical protein
MDSVNFMEEASQNHTIEDTGAKYLAMDKCRAKIKDKNSYLYIVLCGVINKQGRRARAGGEAGIPDFNLQPSRAFFFLRRLARALGVHSYPRQEHVIRRHKAAEVGAQLLAE